MFQIQPSSPEPIYRQLIEQVRRMVASGQLAAGAGLPSVREVAQTLAVNPMTVSKAYSLLEAEGLLERLRGKGMVVACQRELRCTFEERMRLLEPALRAVARQAHELELDAGPVLARFRELLEDKT